MSETAVALRYAEALYELAREQGRASEVLEDVAELKRSLDASPDAWQSILNPGLAPAAKERLLDETVLEGRDPHVQNLVRVMIRHRREDAFTAFFPVYLDVHERREGILRIRVETAKPLEEEVESQIQEKLKSATGRPVVMETRSDATLLGGMRFVIGSEVIDGSVRGQLERMRRQLLDTRLG